MATATDYRAMTILLHSSPFTPTASRTAPLVGPLPEARTQGRPTTSTNDTPVAILPVATLPVTTLPVTTLREAVRIALDRTRRMTLLGSVPVLRIMALPWLLPLHLLIVGLTADHIRHTPDASLSYSDGTAPRVHTGSLVLALLLWAGWLGALCGTFRTLWTWGLITPASMVVGLALIVPIVEILGFLDFAVRNPEWVTLKRARNRHPDRRSAFILTSLVSTRDGCGAARRLMDLTYPQWAAADAVVIGYPASKSLISYYIRMGARRYGPGPAPVSRTARSRPTGRCVTFDCRRPLRTR